MNQNQRMALVPKYMHDFACIGADCEDSCCIGWQVNIDEATYKKYNRIREPELKPLIEKNIARVKSNRSEINYAKIRINQTTRSCPFLSEGKLCKLQQKLGEDYLSDTCTSYPRVTSIVNGVLERSATLSCPEVARLALLNPAKMEFDEIVESAQLRSIISKSIDTRSKKFRHTYVQYFWELRIFTIKVLQLRTYALWERLVLLGLFFQKVEEYINSGQYDEIPELIETYTNIINDGSLREQLNDIPVNYSIQIKLMIEIIEERLNSGGINTPRYLECLQEMIQGLKYDENATVEECTEYYKKSFDMYFVPFMKEHEYILENYLVNYVYMNFFPIGNYDSVFEEYVMLAVHYAMIKLHLIGISGLHQGLNTEHVIKLIQSFTKVLSHDQQFLQNLIRLLKKDGYTSLPYMTILIKN
ncbi:flagellin lysine-N-methylase [Paenibacillus sp. SI8]|uniref:flagellin lysine-N-methylase n=1 Tax=unclassified Paenibacillus TaxID=185978 RepID=UPI0034652CFD